MKMAVVHAPPAHLVDEQYLDDRLLVHVKVRREGGRVLTVHTVRPRPAIVGQVGRVACRGKASRHEILKVLLLRIGVVGEEDDADFILLHAQPLVQIRAVVGAEQVA